MSMEGFPRILPFSPDELEELTKAAALEGHGVFFPTEVIKKQGRHIGWLSRVNPPNMWLWLSSTQASPRESLEVIHLVETVQRTLGCPGITVPCKESSPFYPILGRLGYNDLGTYHIFYKDL